MKLGGVKKGLSLMSVPNFRKSYHMGFEKNCRKSWLSKQFDKTGNSEKSIQPKIGAIER